MSRIAAPLLAALALSALARGDDSSPLGLALRSADRAIASGDLPEAKRQIDRAIERDPRSSEAWAARARWAEGAGNRDELAFSLHTQLRLRTAQKAPRAERDALMARLSELDPQAAELLALRPRFVAKVAPIAERYEKEHRPHAAIRAHQLLLALDPERAASEEAIKKISNAPDPSLAPTAKPKDLLADVSEEWMHEHDAQHGTWETRAKLERDHYTTNTDGGYAVLVRAAEAMEQMSAFYRTFFRYGGGDDRRSVPRIDLNIFKTRAEYLKLGIGPPVEWSAGHFTGGAVETYIGDGGFEEMVGTLFHEAAHQFVSMATNAAGWMNEGLASYFEGTRILANGTVVMNLPANHRLFPLVERMERGWMETAGDGIDPKAPSKSSPEKAPTFRIVLENEYEWGPPWYAPTWGVVFFLYNYQDPLDGRFVYRDSFWEYVNKSGGRVGKGAIEIFEKTVLANPLPPTPKLPAAAGKPIALPKTVEELNDVWKEWLTALRDEQSGKFAGKRPYLEWGRYALARKQPEVAAEHFEKGLEAAPDDAELCLEYAKLLGGTLKNTDRAAKLALQALRAIETRETPDAATARAAEQLLEKWDPQRKSLDQIRAELAVAGRAIVQRYLDSSLPRMAAEVSFQLASELGVDSMWDLYEMSAERCGGASPPWKLAYNEKDLKGWAAGRNNEVFRPEGEAIVAKFGTPSEEKIEFRFLTLDTVTSGDFSMESEVLVEPGKGTFCGLVFGRKSATTFHSLIVHAPRKATVAGTNTSGFVDLTSFYGDTAFKIWRHNAVNFGERKEGTSANSAWHRLRLDVTGTLADVWFDGALVVTQDFGTPDVLRGSFGLIVGPGESRFQNIRYIARAARDRAARIERAIRLKASGGPLATGSFVGALPPWPAKIEWLQAPRASWEEKAGAPTLLVLWSLKQSQLIPIDAWLNDLHERTRDIDLQIVCIAAAEDARGIVEALKAHPLPGSVGIDKRGNARMGETFRQYSIDRFSLPRVILLDVNQRVVWEGDPGLKAGEVWRRGQPTYLDDPLEALVAKRKLRDLAAWRTEWRERTVPALRDGDVAAASPSLKRARELDAASSADVASAHARLAAMESALASMEAIASSLAQRNAEPAIAALAAWAPSIGKPVDAAGSRAVKTSLATENAHAWEKALDLAKSARKQTPPDKAVDAATRLREKIVALPGALPAAFADSLKAAIDSGDGAAALRAMENAEKVPARFLAHEVFHW